MAKTVKEMENILDKFVFIIEDMLPYLDHGRYPENAVQYLITKRAKKALKLYAELKESEVR